MEEKIRVGISACLLGQTVRYDGNHKHDPYLTATLGRYLEFVPVCPEAESGMGVPREAMRLEGDPDAPRLITRGSRIDKTDPLVEWRERKLGQLADAGLCGFILKAKSPSCGMERVKIYGAKGMPTHSGAGLFAGAFMARFPELPVEEEGRLHDMKLRENFIERLFVHQRWRALGEGGDETRELAEFHRRHKLLIMAHSPRHYRELGRLAAGDGALPPGERQQAYGRGLQEALRLLATPKKNANVLQHIQGYFKRQLSGDEKRELGEVIDAYRRELLPLIVPITLLNHYVRKYDEPYLQEQWYLNPHPLELKLRNHV
ncbi:YbgA family protein [Endothiovibrio diazotrophicus]